MDKQYWLFLEYDDGYGMPMAIHRMLSGKLEDLRKYSAENTHLEVILKTSIIPNYVFVDIEEL